MLYLVQKRENKILIQQISIEGKHCVWILLDDGNIILNEEIHLLYLQAYNFEALLLKQV